MESKKEKERKKKKKEEEEKAVSVKHSANKTGLQNDLLSLYQEFDMSDTCNKNDKRLKLIVCRQLHKRSSDF